MSATQFLRHGGLQFQIDTRENGLRIYAIRDGRMVGGLDAECDGNFLAISVIYIAPRWRNMEIDKALQAAFFRYLDARREQ